MARTGRMKAAEAEQGVNVSGIALGTPVLTLQGALPVEHLTPGDRIITRNGARRLVAITPLPPAGVVRLSASTLGVEQPQEDIIVGADTPVKVTDWRARAFGGTDHAMVEARWLCDGEFIRREPAGAHRLFRLEFDQPEVIYAGGIEIGIAPQVAEV